MHALHVRHSKEARGLVRSDHTGQCHQLGKCERGHIPYLTQCNYFPSGLPTAAGICPCTYCAGYLMLAVLANSACAGLALGIHLGA